jgi:type II secretory ATPase GspE/PulE/Tfp pilus assembly ATPase PilB-like protein
VRVAGSLVGLPGEAEVDIFEQAGCHRCRETGYRGRIGLFEVMTVTNEIRALIVERARAGQIAEVAISQGMRTLVDDGLDKVRAGHTSLAEIGRVTG